MSNALHTWAGEHLAYGYCPVPTVRGSKGACIPWKPWQTARPQQADLDAWFNDAVSEERNLALVTGAFHGLVVVDADDDDAVRFAKLQFGPTPYRVCTRRGMHFYYRHPGAGIHVQTKAGVIPGRHIDVRGDGGMITGLGSVHASGFTYCLDRGADVVSAASLPVFDLSWLPRVEPLTPPTLWRGGSDLGAIERAERYLVACEGAGAGGRNQNTFRVAASVVRDFGLSFDQGWALLSIWNEQRNDPPLPEDELQGIVRSCLSHGRRPLGGRLSDAIGSREWNKSDGPSRPPLQRPRN